jgi:hypothetical protein
MFPKSNSDSRPLKKNYLSAFLLLTTAAIFLFVIIHSYISKDKNIEATTLISSYNEEVNAPTVSKSLNEASTLTVNSRDFYTQSLPDASTDTIDLLIESRTILIPLLEEMQDKVEIGFHQSGGLWWINKDELSIFDSGAINLEIRDFNCALDLEEKSEFREKAILLGNVFDEILTKNGFIMNQRNTSKSIDDTQFYDYIRAYEKGSKKVTFTASPDCGGDLETEHHYSFTLSISDKYELKEKEQSSYLRDLDYGPDTVIFNIIQSGDFMTYEKRGRRFGTTAIAKKIEGKWTELFIKQGGPPDCVLVQKFSIPKELVSSCFDEKNNLVTVP